MNHDIAVSEEGGIRINVPIAAYECDPICPKCATPGLSRLASLARQIRGESPISTVQLRFCEGAKPIAEPVNGIETVFTGRTERTHICAGLERQHLHANCGRCGYHWLLECADRND